MADQFGHVRAVDDVLDHRLVERDANRAAEVTLLLRQLDQPVHALAFQLVQLPLVLQCLEHDDQRLADAQEAADGAGAAGQRQRLLQMIQRLLAPFPLPVQLRQQDVIAIQVHDQAVLLGVGLQLAQDRQRLFRLFQRQVGAHMVAAVELGEVVEPALQPGRGEQPLLDSGLVLGRIPVAEHHRMGVGQPVDVVVVVGQHALHPADVVGADGLLATRVGDAGEQCIALQEPAIADVLENLDALQRALLSGVQVVPFQQDLATHPVDELHDRRRLQLGLLDVLDGALLQRIGLLQIALGDGDFRQLAQVPHHQVRGTNLPGAALGLLVLFLRLGQQPLDEVRLGQPRQRRHPGGAHDQRLTRQRFIGQGDGLLLVAAVHRHLRTYRVELADDARPVLFRAAFLQGLFAGLEPAFYLVELVRVLRHPGLQQGEQRRAGDDRLRQGFQALLQQTQATLAIELLAVALQHLANLHRTAGLYGVAGGLFRHVFRQQRFGGA